MTPLQRKAAFRSAATLRQVTMADAARQLGVSYNHLTLVLRGDRTGSVRLDQAIAAFIGRPVADVFSLSERSSTRKRHARP